MEEIRHWKVLLQRWCSSDINAVEVVEDEMKEEELFSSEVEIWMLWMQPSKRSTDMRVCLNRDFEEVEKNNSLMEPQQKAVAADFWAWTGKLTPSESAKAASARQSVQEAWIEHADGNIRKHVISVVRCTSRKPAKESRMKPLVKEHSSFALKIKDLFPAQNENGAFDSAKEEQLEKRRPSSQITDFACYREYWAVAHCDQGNARKSGGRTGEQSRTRRRKHFSRSLPSVWPRMIDEIWQASG